MKKSTLLTNLFVLLTACIGHQAFAAGLEQELMWSGKYVGMASANTASVNGPESLYFNPAGLMSSKDTKNEFAFDLSYLPAKFKAPVTANDQEISSKSSGDIVGAVMYSRQLNDKWAFGVGIFPVGGNTIKYDDVDLGNGITGAPKTELQIIEFSPAAAYKLDEHWSFGLGYRVTYVKANYSVVVPDPGSTILEFKNLQGWDFFSFRAGAQYKADNWGLGLNIRSPVRFKAKGKMDGRSVIFGDPVNADPASLTATFPMTILLGSFYKVNEHLTLLFDYNFLNYSQTKTLGVDAGPVPDQPLKWRDGHLFRLGAQYVWTKLALRAGYIFETSITNRATATPQTEVPGLGHFFTVGAGYTFSDTVEANVSAHYGFSSDHVPGDAAAGVLSGKYSAYGFGLHTGVNWGF